MSPDAPAYPMTRDDWANRIQSGIGLSRDAGSRQYDSDRFPHEELRRWLELEFAADQVFADAVVRNVRSVAAWVYGGEPEPLWTGSDPQFGQGRPPVIHVEIPVRNLARAREFYGRVLGWRFGSEQEDQAGRFTWFMRGQLVGGKLRESEGAQFGDGVQIYCAVDDLDNAVGDVTAAGGSVVAETTRAGWGRYALIKDPDGTVLAVCGP